MTLPLIELFYEGVDTIDVFSSWYIPIVLSYYIGFFLIFDFVPNFYADLTGFADR